MDICFIVDTTTLTSQLFSTRSFQEKDRCNRFQFLLNQTELFSHFLTSGDQGGSASKTSAGNSGGGGGGGNKKAILSPHKGRPKVKKDEKSKLLDQASATAGTNAELVAIGLWFVILMKGDYEE